MTPAQKNGRLSSQRRVLVLGLRTLVRDWKSGEFAVLAVALLVAVSALTAIGFFTDRVAQTVSRQASEVLAADLRLRSGQELDAGIGETARDMGLRSSQTMIFPSVVLSGEASNLAQIKAVSTGYPLRGRMLVSNGLFQPADVAAGIPASGEVWAETGLLARLGVDVGAELEIGAKRFKVTRVLDYRPDQSVGFVSLAPTALINYGDVPETGLVQPGSRIRYALLIAGEQDALKRFREAVEDRLEETARIQDLGDASEQVVSAVERAQRFLGLSALVSVLVAAIAVAMAARRYALRHLDGAALMKCLGASQGLVLQLSMLQLLIIALVAGLLGSGLGYLAQQGLSWLLSDLVRGELPLAGPRAGLLGLGTSFVILIGFALPQLLQLKTVPPARVLRKDLSPPELRYAFVYGVATAAFAALLWWFIRDLTLLIVIGLGLGATIAVLWVGGWVLVKMVAGLRGRVGIAWRYGLANITRRGRESVIQVVAFGMGLTVLLLLTFVRNDLLQEWQANLPDNAPNNFLINIQRHQLDGIAQQFADFEMGAPEFVPLVRARITHINEQALRDIKFDNPQRQSFATREVNLTWADTISTSNKLLEGSWWDPGYQGPAEISLEVDAARDLGVSLGDTVTFGIAGESLSASVTSLRFVEWDSFQPNFFMVLSPGALEEFPVTFITSVYVPRDDRQMLLELVRAFPSVTVLDLEAILEQVRTVMDQASLAVQYVFLFTVLAGVTVLLAAVLSSREERLYESATLRALGAQKRTIMQGILAEFTALGLLSGSLASLAASAVGALVAIQLFNLEYSFDPLLWLAGLLLGVVTVGSSGVLATRSVVHHPPINTLRDSA